MSWGLTICSTLTYSSSSFLWEAQWRFATLRKFGRILISGLLACVLAPSQTTSTEILGLVTDPSGAVVPDARVTLLRVATGERRQTSSLSNGEYSFPLIEIGEYVVTVTKPGFKTQEKTGVVVQLQQKARVNLELSVGESSQTVAVIASGVELKTEDAAVGQVVENKRVVELPLNGRNIGALAVLTAGVQWGARYGVTDTGTNGFPIAGRMVSVSANGQRDTNQRITLDGVKGTDPIDNAMNFTPSVDAIEEFKVQTSSYSAEYGGNSGALVQVAFKSGGNRFHGTLYEFLRNDKMDSSDYFLNFQLPAGAPRSSKNRLRRNQFGSFLSGPVLVPKIYNGKDRTFWSFSYEQLRQTDENVQFGFFFPQAFRNGDFSALLRPQVVNGRPVRAPIVISDPLTGQPFTDGQGDITNIIPPSRINKNAQNFINQYQPLPQFQQPDTLANNVQVPVPTITTANQYIFRIDHEFRRQDKVFVRLIADRPKQTVGNLNPSFQVFVDAPTTNMAFQHIHLFSPHVLNEFRYGLNNNFAQGTNRRTGTDFNLNSLGIGDFRVGGTRLLTAAETGIPGTLVGADGDSGWGTKEGTQHEISENFSVNRGSHNLKTGVDYMRVLTYANSSNSPRGSLGTSAAVGGYALAGWLMGYLDNSTTPEGLPPAALNQNRWSAYFLDDWKVSRKLTLNLGLRWDYFQVPLDDLGGIRTLRLGVLTQASDGRMLPTVIPAPRSRNYAVTSSDNRYFMPRAGFAYRMSDKWIIRGGGGWFVNAQQLNNYAILSRIAPNGGAFGFNTANQVAQTINYTYSGQNYSQQTRQFTPGSQILTLDNAFPGQSNLAIPPRSNLLVLTPDNRYTNVWQWSFDIQRALPLKTVLTIAYVGSKTSNIDTTMVSWNLPPPNTNTNIAATRPYQAYVSLGEGNAPRGLGQIRYLDNFANGSYQGLQTTVEKRYSRGFIFNLAYTFSKSLGEGYERNSGNSNSYQDPANRRAERGRYLFDTSHNAVVSFVYEMPFLNRFKGVAGGFLAGWQVNGIVTLHTGSPFGLSGGNLNTGGISRPDRIADGRLGDKATRQLWFDPTAFRRTDCNIPGRLDLCHYGNAATDILNRPGARNADVSIYKNWRIQSFGEAARIQFRLEAFNATNSPHFGQPIGIGFVSPNAVVPDAPQQGEIRSLVSPMRILQLGLKLYF